MSDKRAFKVKYSRDSRLRPCPLCGCEMLGRWKNHYGTKGWNFSCSNERCLLHRSVNVLRVPRFHDGSLLSEDEAVAIVNGEMRLPVPTWEVEP